VTKENELTQYMSEVQKYPLLTREQEVELGKKALSGNKKAIDKLVVSNLRFVVQIAHQYRTYTKSGKITLLDIIQAGNEGLMKAAKKYDPDTGNRFATYAVWWIRAQIQKQVIDNFSLVKMGTTTIQRAAFFKMGMMRKLQEIKDPDEKEKVRDELMNQLGVTPEQMQDLEERIYWHDTSLNVPMNGDGVTEHIEALKSPFPSQLNKIVENDLNIKTKHALENAMKLLSEREQQIITRRWLSDDKETLQTIGEYFGVSRERIRQIESKAFGIIRDQLKGNNDIDSFLNN
jgi:RNA polymerase sigma-32 factor